MTTPSRSVPAPRGGDIQPDRPSFWTRAVAFLGREWRWVLILAAYLVAWCLPLGWSWDKWGNPRDPMMMQLWIPVLAAILAWSRREEISAAIERVQEFRSRNYWTRGNSIPLIIGSLILVFGHIVHVKGIAVLGLVLIVPGAVYYLYGMPVIRAAIAPLLFLCLVIPPPDSVINNISKMSLRGAVTGTSFLFSMARIPTMIDPRGFIRFTATGDTVEIKDTISPLGIMLPVLTLALWYVLLRRYSLKKAVSTLTLATIVSMGVGLLQCVLLARIHAFSPKLSDALMAGAAIRKKYFMTLDGQFQFSGILQILWEVGIAWFWVMLAFGLTVWIMNRESSIRTEQLARPTGAVVNKVGNFIGILLSPIMLIFTLLGKIGKLFTRMERGTEKMLSRMTRKKRRGDW